MNIKIGDEFYYNSTKPDVDSFTFKVFQIGKESADIIINNEMYRKLKITEFENPNIKKIKAGDDV